MMVTVSNFRADMQQYLDLAQTETIYLTKHDEIVAIVSNTPEVRYGMLKSKRGIIPKDTDLEKLKEERILKC